ncbi:MAG: hypothetical protein J7L37_04615 [Thermococcus sp.]|nr:hypothetical protein [Thermococcus sp.]
MLPNGDDFDEEEVVDTSIDEPETSEEPDGNGGEDELLKMLMGSSEPVDEDGQEQNEGPVDTPDKFITPDLIELPPKWFYEKVRDRNLPKGMQITQRAKEILDKVYFDGKGRTDLINEDNIPMSSVNFAFKRIRELWKLYKTGVLDLDSKDSDNDTQVKNGPGRPKGSKAPAGESATVLRLTGSTTTFKEIDRTIATFLAPQIERSAQFQEVMARIGMVTTYAMMQLGILDKTKFVTLAKAVAEDPDYLYDYVVGQLDGLISVIDEENLKRFTKELMYLRQLNQRLMQELEEKEMELEKHRQRIRDAVVLVSLMWDYLTSDEQFEVASLYRRYKNTIGGGVLAKSEAD